MSTNQSIIIYRSRYEQEANDAWFKLRDEHPGFFLAINLGIIAMAASVFIAMIVKSRRIDREQRARFKKMGIDW